MPRCMMYQVYLDIFKCPICNRLRPLTQNDIGGALVAPLFVAIRVATISCLVLFRLFATSTDSDNKLIQFLEIVDGYEKIIEIFQRRLSRPLGQHFRRKHCLKPASPFIEQCNCLIELLIVAATSPVQALSDSIDG